MRAYNYVLLYVETVSRLKDYVREFECKSVLSFAVHTCVSESVCYVYMPLLGIPVLVFVVVVFVVGGMLLSSLSLLFLTI